MNKVDQLISTINKIVKTEEDDLKEDLKDIAEVDKVVDYINDFESKIAELLREQKKHFIDGINSFLAKEASLKDVINYVKQDLMAADEFAEKLELETKEILELSTEDLTKLLMETVDREVIFEVFSDKTTDWIKTWAKDLAVLMKLKTHSAIEEILDTALKEGQGIAIATDNLKDLSAFDRKRARTTAITEILTAHSVAQQEAYMQSPAVVKKKWKHSGTRRIKPREDHIAIDGIEINVDEMFDVGGEEGEYPRDSRLSAKQRVNCHCTMGPVTDSSILKLTKEEKEKLRDEALKECNDEWKKKLEEEAQQRSVDYWADK